LYLGYIHKFANYCGGGANG